MKIFRTDTSMSHSPFLTTPKFFVICFMEFRHFAIAVIVDFDLAI